MCGKSCVVVMNPEEGTPQAQEIRRRARASADVQLGSLREAQRSRRRDPSARSRETLLDARTPLGTLVGLVRAICMLLCALHKSTAP